MKRLVLINTAYGLLQYVLFDKNWKEHTYVVVEKDLPINLPKSLSKKVKQCHIIERTSIRFHNGLSLLTKDIKIIKKLESIISAYDHVYGNMAILKFIAFTGKKIHVNDGLMTLNILLHGSDIRHYSKKSIIKKIISKIFGFQLELDIDNCSYILPDTNEYRTAGEKYDAIYLDYKKIWFEMSTAERAETLELYDTNEEYINRCGGMGNLLLTQPLSEHGYCSESDKIGLYKSLLVEENIQEERLTIKPHPSEKTKYQDIFPKALVLANHFPSDFLGFYDIRFEKALTLFSSGLSSISAKKIVFRGSPKCFTEEKISGYVKDLN